jgi:hypothetical protein
VCSRLSDKEFYTAFNDVVITVTVNECVAVNASAYKSLIIKNAENKNYKVLNCMGNKISEGIIKSNLEEIAVPVAGIIFIN